MHCQTLKNKKDFSKIKICWKCLTMVNNKTLDMNTKNKYLLSALYRAKQVNKMIEKMELPHKVDHSKIIHHLFGAFLNEVQHA